MRESRQSHESLRQIDNHYSESKSQLSLEQYEQEMAKTIQSTGESKWNFLKTKQEIESDRLMQRKILLEKHSFSNTNANGFSIQKSRSRSNAPLFEHENSYYCVQKANSISPQNQKQALRMKISKIDQQ